ncbi:hypothetical protein WN944_028270 [Citrus x changshan-huyou]|uniref:Uncharacterized protein n=1 Tax=Citrus x changshan-huyou TaxID=2935761 RepID=A0AAP0QDS2_9ROSI
MEDFLSTLAMEPNRNTSAYESYHRIYVPHGIPLKSNAHEPLVLIFSFNIYKRCFQVTARERCVNNAAIPILNMEIHVSRGKRFVILLSRVRCEQELVEAIETAAVEKKDCSQGRYRQRTA